MSELSMTAFPGESKSKASEWPPDEFLAMVFHGLRNPISAILGWADVVSAKPDAETSARAIEAIKRSARLEVKLINQLLEFSRISNDVLELDAQIISLVSTLERAIENLKPQARAKAIEIEAELVESAIDVVGDSARLQQVFTNLLSNAIKFTPSGGEVRVRVEYQRNCTEITVSDTGCGISPQFLPFVFDRFSQQVADKNQHGGLGIGLAITRYLVEKHGGKISADSRGTGQGATFTVRFPVGGLNLQSPKPSNVTHGYITNEKPQRSNSGSLGVR